ncbi:hypothetical protein PENTCL1PPCAC_13940, partial [Pristionchus entomophagus]
GRWNYGAFWERVLDNPQLPIPEWSEARQQIAFLFKSLRSNLLDEARRYMSIHFRPFHSIYHPLLPGESIIEHEKRSHFSTLEYFDAIYKLIERKVNESCHPE